MKAICAFHIQLNPIPYLSAYWDKITGNGTYLKGSLGRRCESDIAAGKMDLRQIETSVSFLYPKLTV